MVVLLYGWWVNTECGKPDSFEFGKMGCNDKCQMSVFWYLLVLVGKQIDVVRVGWIDVLKLKGAAIDVRDHSSKSNSC